jgi:hypothetical protein
MGKVKNFVMEVQETVWDFFDQDGNFVADKTIKNKDDLLRFVKHWFGSMGVDIAKQEIFEIETADHFSQ